jgi:guanylate cyclase
VTRLYIARWRNTAILAFFVMNIVAVSTVTFVVLQYFVGKKDEAYGLLAVEQDRSERLLLNVLPREIAEQLKEDTATIANRFESISILFADIVGFTPMFQEMDPEQTVELLNRLFSYFDTLVERLGVEKIRTIGDSYMAAAGVPTPRPDHATALAEMAIEIRDHVRSTPSSNGHHVDLQIGINSGPAVAGVIGSKKFQYDVWGDAVNIASRMESHGIPGRIQITEATRNLIEDEFVCTPRGEIDVKGRGRMNTWFLEQRVDPPKGAKRSRAA